VQTEQLTWRASKGWQSRAGARIDAHLVLYFGTSDALGTEGWYRDLRTLYPDAHPVGCTSDGQIQHATISETGIAAVAVRLAATRLRIATESVAPRQDLHTVSR